LESVTFETQSEVQIFFLYFQYPSIFPLFFIYDKVLQNLVPHYMASFVHIIGSFRRSGNELERDSLSVPHCVW